jgi:hypothetical protein
MFFEHAAGVPTAALEPEIRDRALRHHHHKGEVTDSAGAAHHDEHDGEHEH